METGISVQTKIDGDWTIQVVGVGTKVVPANNMSLFELALQVNTSLTPKRVFAAPLDSRVVLMNCRPELRFAVVRVTQPAGK
jgi:hypothetical protein